VVAMIWLGANVPREFCRQLDEGSIWLHAELPAVSRLRGQQNGLDLRDAVSEFPRDVQCGAPCRANDDGTDPWTPSHVEASVGLRPSQHVPSYSWPPAQQERFDSAHAARCASFPSDRVQPTDHRYDHRKLFEPHALLSADFR